MTLTAGTILQNRYRIVSLLGQGGMGAVYRAWHLTLNTAVVVKEMLPQVGLDAVALAQLQAQFQQEAAILARLDHPHLVRVLDFFAEGGNTYLVMSFVPGESLIDRLSRAGAQSEAQVLAWADQLLAALAYCHSQGVIHRDVKPHNVIIGPDGQVVLVDFGLAKRWTPQSPYTQAALRGMGTPEYAPPEQYGGEEQHTDPRSDLYSLGATLYHALTGQAPPTASHRMARPADFQPLRRLAPQVSARTEAVILQALALPMEQRFASAQAMREALALSTPSVRAGDLRPRWWWAVVAVILGLVVVWGEFMGSRRTSPSSTPALSPGAELAATFTLPAAGDTSPPEASPTSSQAPTVAFSAPTTTMSPYDFSSPTPLPENNAWPMFMGDERHSGFYDTEVILPLHVVWTYQIAEPIRMSSAAIANGLAYIGSEDGRLYAVDIATGKATWSFQTGEAIVSSPAVAQQTVYIGSRDGYLYALDSDTGKEKWRFLTGKGLNSDAGDGVDSSPLVIGNLVYFGSNDGSVYAVDVATGILKWKFRTGARVFSSPAYDDGVIYVGSDDHYVYALDAMQGPRDNQPLWKYDTGASVGSSPAIANGKLYIGDLDGRIYALESRTGTLLWQRDTKTLTGETEHWILSTPALADNLVYVTTFSHLVLALDARSGAIVSSFTADEVLPASPIVVGDLLLVGSYSGNLLILDAQNLQPRQSSLLLGGAISSSGAWVNGRLLVGSENGILYALGEESLVTPLFSQATATRFLESDMVKVPAGEFIMGSDGSEADEKPVHTVFLDTFWIDKYEVTNADFEQFILQTGYQTDAEREGWGSLWANSQWNRVNAANWRFPNGPGSGISGIMDHPVVQVSWNDALAFCHWQGKRLPTEAEWEKSARGVAGSIYPWGNNYDPTRMNSSQGGQGGTQRVGSNESGCSPYGAYDMAGNVWEWTADWYQSDYYFQSPARNPPGPVNGTLRSLRGGAWDYSGGDSRSADRGTLPPDGRGNTIGFRCAFSS